MVHFAGKCRKMISDVAADDFPVDEDAETAQLLIDGMFNARMEVTDANIDKCLELARKYDVDDMHDNCALYLACVPLTRQSLPRWLGLAATYGIDAAVQRCQDFIKTADDFDAMSR